MGAPAGNQFWRIRSKHGRDKIFSSPAILWEAACEYFQWCEENPMYSLEQAKASIKQDPEDPNQGLIKMPLLRPFTIAGLCTFLKVNTKYFNDFNDSLKGKTDDLSKGFSEVIAEIEDIIYNQKFSGAATGLFNANLISRELGLADRKEVENKGGQVITIQRNIVTKDESKS